MFNKGDRVVMIKEDQDFNGIYKVSQKGTIIEDGPFLTGVIFDDGRKGYVYTNRIEKLNTRNRDSFLKTLQRGDLIVISKNAFKNLESKNNIHNMTGGDNDLSERIMKFAGIPRRTLNMLESNNEVAVELDGNIEYVPSFAIRKPYKRELSEVE